MSKKNLLFLTLLRNSLQDVMLFTISFKRSVFLMLWSLFTPGCSSLLFMTFTLFISIHTYGKVSFTLTRYCIDTFVCHRTHNFRIYFRFTQCFVRNSYLSFLIFILEDSNNMIFTLL